jgi:hypothetical protein
MHVILQNARYDCHLVRHDMMDACGWKSNFALHQHRVNLGQNEVKLPKKQLGVIENNIIGLSQTL